MAKALVEYTVTEEFLLGVPVPAQTSTYKPVSHGRLIDLTRGAIRDCGFKLKKEVYTSSRDGLRANGKYLIEFGNDPDMSIMIAWQNSYDKKISLKFAIGTWVFICENGMCKSDIASFKTKHVGDVQEVTPEKIKEYICQAAETFYELVDEKETMKGINLTEQERAELLGRMFIIEEVITSTQLNAIKREIQEPTYDYNSPGTVWEFYNYCTFAIKNANPRYWLQVQEDLHQFFTVEFNI